MPSPQTALEYAKRYVAQMPVDDAAVKYRILDDAHAKLWMSAPWRWSLGSLEVVTLVNDQQEVNLGSAYSDLLYVVHSGVWDGQTKNDLLVAGVLPVTTAMKGIPKLVQYVAGSPNKLRFLPVPTGYPLANMPKVVSAYKKKMTAITEDNWSGDYDTTFGIPKEWFWVYQEIVLLKAMEFAHDPRLGGVSFSEGRANYAGQYGVVEAAVQEMRNAEKKFFDSIGMVVTE